MYHFAIVALLGLAVYKTVEFVLGILGIELRGAIKTFVTLGFGVVATELLDYSVFAGWGIEVRETWMGPLFTGLMVGAMTYVWHEALGYIGSKRGSSDSSSDQRTPRAA
ncbi:MAG TPA: hypothetical protein VJ922_01820 [Actinomycetota bacterium]|nr:hypothetical protein [Actinomycetota bacterium]